MNMRLICSVLLASFSSILFADGAVYCPQNHAYINEGMTQEEVLAACGQPTSKQESEQPLMKKIPVQQLIYNNKGTSTGFYGVWNIPTGSGGANLEVDVINNVVKGVKMNGSDANAFSICGNTSIQDGDAVGKVYGACGNPSIVNNTFIQQAVPSQENPQVWIYQSNQYQPRLSLTFVDGKLQSINQ